MYCLAESELYIFVKMLNHYRKNYTLWDQPMDQITVFGGNPDSKWSKDNVYGFSRGQVLVLLTNAQDANGWRPERSHIVLPPQLYNLTLTNILDPQDRITVDGSGSVAVQMRQDRQPQIYVPVALDPTAFGVPRAPAHVRSPTHVSWVVVERM